MNRRGHILGPAVLAAASWVLIMGAAVGAGADGPELSPLVFLPGDATVAPAAGLQELPAIAAGGTGWLTVWADARSSVMPLPAFTGGPYFSPGIGTMRDIYALRLDDAGEPIDEMPIVVSQAVLNQGSPEVAWNGQNWLVVWMGQAGLACCPNIHIYAARVAPDGTVLDDPPIVVDTDATTNGLYWPAVASDGTNWIVAWRDLDGGVFTIDGARISPGGVVLDPGGKRLRRDSYNSYPTHPDLAFSGSELLLVWNEDSDEIAAQRLTPALDPVGGVFRVNLQAGSAGHRPSAASDGAGFFVAWFEDRFYGYAQLFGTRVSSQGQILDPNGIEITPASGYTQFVPSVVWDGAQWIVAYNIQKSGFDDDLYATRVSAAGTVLDPDGVLLGGGASGAYEPDAAPVPGGGARVVWQALGGSPSLDGDIRGAALSAGGGSLGPPATVSLGAPRQTLPDLVWNGSGYLAVFRSQTSSELRLLGQRLDAGGTAIDVEPFVIAVGDPSWSGPSAAWDGTRYLVAWSTGPSRVQARRLAPDGTPLDAAPIEVMPGNNPDVAALGGVFLVVATHAQDPHFRYPFSRRVRGVDGVLLDPGPVLIGSYFATNAVVRPFGDRWLAAWQQNPTHDNVRANIAANFVGADGAASTAFMVTSTSVTIEEDPFVSAGPDTAFIGWADDPTGAYNDDLKARRVLADGTQLDATPLVLSSAAGAQIEPAGDWNGATHVVLFTDQRNDDPNGPYVGDVFGTRVTPGGVLLDPDGFAFSNDPAVPELHPAVAGASAGEAALACAVHVPAAPFGAYRIGVRVLRSGTTETGPAEVATLGRGLAASPNPSAGAVTLAFHNGRLGRVVAEIFDARGRRVRRLDAGRIVSGPARILWDGLDREGRVAPPGVYFVRVVTPEGARLAKIARR